MLEGSNVQSSPNVMYSDDYTTPSLPPPPGQTSNFHGGLSLLQVVLIVVFAVVFFLATVSLFLRLYTSIVIRKKAVELDGFLVIIAWLVSLAFFICGVIGFKTGIAKHAWDVPQADLGKLQAILTPIVILYCWCPTLTKLAICSIYYSLAPFRSWRISLCVVGTAMFVIAAVISGIIPNAWNIYDESTHDLPRKLCYVQVTFNIFFDLVLIIMPLPILIKMNMPSKQKFLVVGMLSLGSAVLVATIIRAPYACPLFGNPDITWAVGVAIIWSHVELNIGIVCNNMMRMKPFIRLYFPNLGKYLSWFSTGSTQDPCDNIESGLQVNNAYTSSTAGSVARHDLKHQHQHQHISTDGGGFLDEKNVSDTKYPETEGNPEPPRPPTADTMSTSEYLPDPSMTAVYIYNSTTPRQNYSTKEIVPIEPRTKRRP